MHHPGCFYPDGRGHEAIPLAGGCSQPLCAMENTPTRPLKFEDQLDEWILESQKNLPEGPEITDDEIKNIFDVIMLSEKLPDIQATLYGTLAPAPTNAVYNCARKPGPKINSVIGKQPDTNAKMINAIKQFQKQYGRAFPGMMLISRIKAKRSSHNKGNTNKQSKKRQRDRLKFIWSSIERWVKQQSN